jgi:ribosome-associated protein
MSDSPTREVEPKPSKSQLKRDARAMFDLGRELVALDQATLNRLPMDSRLREAVETARNIKSRIAHKRQLQRIAGVLRGMDATPLQDALEAKKNEARQLTVRHHRVEAWRDRLLAEGDAALRVLLNENHAADAQALRTLIRNAQREAEQGKPPASARKLFKVLRDMDESHPLPLG